MSIFAGRIGSLEGSKKLLHILILLTAFTLEKSPRIITLDPSATELVYDLKLNAKLVGRDQASNHPKKVARLPVVSRHLQWNKEKIIELQADWILAHDIGFEKLESNFKPWGIRVLILQNQSPQDYLKNVKKLLEHFESKKSIEQIAKQVSLEDLPDLNASYIALIDSTLKIASGKGSFLAQALKKCGLENLVKQDGYPRLSQEFLLTNNADHLFRIEKNAEKESGILLNPDVFSRLSLRFFKGLRKLCEKLEKEAVSDQDN